MILVMITLIIPSLIADLCNYRYYSVSIFISPLCKVQRTEPTCSTIPEERKEHLKLSGY